MSFIEQEQLEKQHLITAYVRKPVQFVRGDGIRLYDDNGKEYLDFLSGIGAVSLGHANPVVAQVISDQANRLLHVSNYFYIEGRGELAEKISDLLNYKDGDQGLSGKGLSGKGSEALLTAQTVLAECPSKTDEHAAAELAFNSASDTDCQGDAWKVFFANSGAEANEGAIKLARKYGNQSLNGATTIITAKKSFHGRTLATTAATGQAVKQEAFNPMPSGFVHLPLNDISALKAEITQPSAGAVCAVLLECIQGEGGVWPATNQYLQEVRELTSAHQLLLIIDEVQTGFCRTGKPFAFMHAGIRPDVVTMAKGIANGFPVGALAATGVAADIFVPGEHGSTFGGSSLAVAAASATIDELLSNDLAGNAEKVGSYFAEKLAELPHVTEVRGKGLMLGISLDKPLAAEVVNQALKQGLVIANIGSEILRFLPPLICSKAEIDTLISKLDEILKRI